MRLVLAALTASLLVAGCPSRQAVQCGSDSDCDLVAGGACEGGGGLGWCAYPAQDCPSGYRYGDDIGGGMAGQCVLGGPDAAVDAPIDTVPIDGPDGPIDGPAGGPVVTTYQAADLVLGQSTFTTAAELPYAANTTEAHDIVVHNGTLWISDGGRSRVLAWAPLPTNSNTDATRVVGRSTFTEITSTGSPTNRNLGSSSYVAVGGGKLVVPDPMRNRVMIWNPVPTSSGTVAALVLGQPDFTSSGFGSGASQMVAPAGAWTDGTRLAVADAINDRVLIWTTFPTTNGEPADLVLGQTGFGIAIHPTTASASNMQPSDVHFDGTRFYVADRNQNRVMVWNSFPTANNQPADFVIGQPNFTSRAPGRSASAFDSPVAITTTADAVFVSDYQNDRVLVFSPIPSSSGASASFVLGQPDMVTGGNNPSPTDRSLDQPRGLEVSGGYLWVADPGHNRALRFALYQ